MQAFNPGRYSHLPVRLHTVACHMVAGAPPVDVFSNERYSSMRLQFQPNGWGHCSRPVGLGSKTVSIDFLIDSVEFMGI